MRRRDRSEPVAWKLKKKKKDNIVIKEPKS